MNRFEIASALTLRFEGDGRISRDPDDPGGPTRWGIAQRWHPGVDVENLSRADACEILRAEYWRPLAADELPWPLAAVLFDHAVHCSTRRAAKALQRTVGAKPDGVVGPLTLAAMWRTWNRAPIPVLDAVLRRRVSDLVDAGLPQYLGGWMGRVANLALWAGRELERDSLWSGREPLEPS